MAAKRKSWDHGDHHEHGYLVLTLKLRPDDAEKLRAVCGQFEEGERETLRILIRNEYQRIAEQLKG